MSDALLINACARPESRTLYLAKKALEITGGSYTELKLYDEDIKPVDYGALTARDKNIECGTYDDSSFRFAKQFADAREIVIAAPYWDLSFPSVLKIYLENICVSGITFKYDNDMPVGLCKAKRIVFISTSGGPFIKEFGANYIETLFYNLFGIEVFISFIAENLDIDGVDIEAILNKTKHQIDEYLK